MVWVQAWNQDLQSVPVLINSGDTEGAEVIFSVTPESGTMEVVVECRAENTAGNVTATHTMDVLFPPTIVVIEGEKETLSAGQKYQYRCSVPESNPPSHMSWEMYDSSMEQVSYIHLDQETKEVEVVVPYNTHTLTIVCTASNSVGKLTERLDITVTRPPSQPQVTGPPSIPEDSPG